MIDLVVEKYLTINGKKQKWKKHMGTKLEQEQFANPDKTPMEILCEKGIEEIAKVVVDREGNPYRAESAEHAEEVQEALDAEHGFKLVGAR